MLPIVVLKFGSSVLASPADLPVVVDEVYRRLRAGTRVLAIVSAFAGRTDQLLAECHSCLGESMAPEVIASYVATGECQSAALLVGALKRAGIAARLTEPREIQLRVRGVALEADPIGVYVAALRVLWQTHTVLVLPGFFGIDEENRTALLGRGGSDLSALFLAHALGAECHLVKDVPGVFDRDPATDCAGAQRYASIPWREAAVVAGPLIQPKALAFAAERRTPFSVTRANGVLETRIEGVSEVTWGPMEGRPPRLRVALLGYGTVGRGVYERLAAQPDRFEILMVASRHPARHIESGLPASLATNVLDRALLPEVDLVIECLGGIEPAGPVIEAALTLGKSVVTANKTVVAARWTTWSEYAQGPKRSLWYSAAVGGAVPVLETIESLHGRIASVRGVINGTCNAVLDALARGESLESAVRAAQEAGFAEADPSEDLSGADAADKLSLMAQAAFGVPVCSRHIARVAVGPQAKASRGQVWRQVARAVPVDGQITLSVRPELVPGDSFIGRTAGADNRIEFTLIDGDTVQLAGQGAGRYPTATAVMGDVQELARRRARSAIHR